MNKRFLVSCGVTAALLLAVCIAPVNVLPASALTAVAGASNQPVPLQINSTQSPAPGSFEMAHLTEAQVVFLLACRCSPGQLPQ
jgi:hypothetical protein